MANRVFRASRGPPKLGVTCASCASACGRASIRASPRSGPPTPWVLIVLFGHCAGPSAAASSICVVPPSLPLEFEQGQGVRGGGLMEFSFPNLEPNVPPRRRYIDKIAKGAYPPPSVRADLVRVRHHLKRAIDRSRSRNHAAARRPRDRLVSRGARSADCASPQHA